MEWLCPLVGAMPLQDEEDPADAWSDYNCNWSGAYKDQIGIQFRVRGLSDAEAHETVGLMEGERAHEEQNAPRPPPWEMGERGALRLARDRQYDRMYPESQAGAPP